VTSNILNLLNAVGTYNALMAAENSTPYFLDNTVGGANRGNTFFHCPIRVFSPLWCEGEFNAKKSMGAGTILIITFINTNWTTYENQYA